MPWKKPLLTRTAVPVVVGLLCLLAGVAYLSAWSSAQGGGRDLPDGSALCGVLWIIGMSLIVLPPIWRQPPFRGEAF